MGGNTDGHVKLNDEEITGGGSSSQWIDVTNTMGSSGTLTSVGVKDNHRLFAIELDGEILTDSASAARVDSLIDSPTNYEADSSNNGGNYCTWNPLAETNATLSNGNLECSLSVGVSSCARGTIGVTSGKWYWEITHQAGDYGCIGISDAAISTSRIQYLRGVLVYYTPSGGLYGYVGKAGATSSESGSYFNNTSYGGSNYNTALVAGDVIGLALDMDNGNLNFYRNGTDLGVANTASLVGKTIMPHLGEAGGNTFTTIANFGQRPFKYTPPTGYKSLCATNLVDPTIADGSDHFDVKLYDGTANYGTTSTYAQTITGLGFSPDLVWIKNKTSNVNNQLFDTVRGIGGSLVPNEYNAEYVDTTAMVTDFTSDGFEVTDAPGSSSDTTGWGVNILNQTYVTWAWDGGNLATNSAYEQSQEWSSGTSTSPSSGSSWANVFANSFSSSWADGTDAWVHNASATLNFNPPLPTGAIQVYATASGPNAVNCYVSFSDGTNTYTTGNLSGVNHAWVDVASGSSLSGITSVTINSGTGSNEGLSLKAIKVAGKELVDAGLIPAGSLNSSVYNQSQVWSTYGTFTGSHSGSYDWAGVFAASNTYDAAGSLYLSSGTGKWTLTSSLACNSEIKIYVNGASSFTINEGLSDEKTVASTSSGFHYVVIPFSGNISSIKLNTATQYTIRIYVDGAALIDQGITLGGTGVPDVPTIASTVRANPSAGFSIVTYTGSGSNGNIAHGLNAAPGLVIVKKRGAAGSWSVWHQAFGTASDTDYIYLDIPNQQAQNGSDSQPFWNDTVPTSNLVSLGTGGNVNGSTATFVAYCFAPVEGYSSFGSYTGNGDPNGNFVFTGFRPALIITKRTDANGGWVLWDTARNTFNVATEELYPDDPSNEYTGGGIDILSNGFKLRNSSAHENNLNGSYIYIAFAEHPFKTARAR